MNTTPKPSFFPFPKMARLSRECVISEKIDGTNAQVYVWDAAHRPAKPGKPGEFLDPVGPAPSDVPWLWSWSREQGEIRIAAGSRTRWITELDDNFAFAKWVLANHEELLKLGHGRHFGEWWGHGIQRGYGMPKGDRRFSLFNTERWNNPDCPKCCSTVPVIWRGQFSTEQTNAELAFLKSRGSYAYPGFMNPEGIVVFHTAANFSFKKTIEGDESPKSLIK